MLLRQHRLRPSQRHTGHDGSGGFSKNIPQLESVAESSGLPAHLERALDPLLACFLPPQPWVTSCWVTVLAFYSEPTLAQPCSSGRQLTTGAANPRLDCSKYFRPGYQSPWSPKLRTRGRSAPRLRSVHVCTRGGGSEGSGKKQPKAKRQHQGNSPRSSPDLPKFHSTFHYEICPYRPRMAQIPNPPYFWPDSARSPAFLKGAFPLRPTC